MSRGTSGRRSVEGPTDPPQGKRLRSLMDPLRGVKADGGRRRPAGGSVPSVGAVSALRCAPALSAPSSPRRRRVPCGESEASRSPGPERPCARWARTDPPVRALKSAEGRGAGGRLPRPFYFHSGVQLAAKNVRGRTGVPDSLSACGHPEARAESFLPLIRGFLDRHATCPIRGHEMATSTRRANPL